MHDFISMPVKLAFLTFRFPELKKKLIHVSEQFKDKWKFSQLFRGS